MSLLRVEAVTRRFGGLLALRDVSLAVDEGEILGLIGPNGAGKTTLFRCIVGALRPSGGRVLFEDQRTDGHAQHTLVQRGVCHTHQIPAPFGDLTVRDNVRVGASFGRFARRAHHVVDEVLQQTGLATVADTAARNLSIGRRPHARRVRAHARPDRHRT
jgi:branched-chain amino acid transport system ATP-binding protein